MPVLLLLRYFGIFQVFSSLPVWAGPPGHAGESQEETWTAGIHTAHLQEPGTGFTDISAQVHPKLYIVVLQMYKALAETTCQFINSLEDLAALNEKLSKTTEFAVDLEVWMSIECLIRLFHVYRCTGVHSGRERSRHMVLLLIVSYRIPHWKTKLCIKEKQSTRGSLQEF